LAKKLVRNAKIHSMKKILAIALVALGFTACSKCYECKAPVEIVTPDTTYTTYQNQELCTADAGEVKQKESEGYECK
jgi:PBP1b-binding outer membrane lipoprotein LpoB